jgi:CHAT domain-containing protein
MTNWKVLIITILISFADSVFGQAQSAESLAEDYFKKGEVLFNLDNASEETYDVAIQYYQKAINLLEEANLRNITLAQCHQRIGSIYLDRDVLDKALDEYHQSLSIKTAIVNLNDSSLYSEYVFLGNIHYYLDRYDSASYYYDKAEKLAIDANGQIADIERIYNSLGVFNFTLGNYQKAITYQDKALSVMPQEGFDFIIAKVAFSYNTATALAKLNRHKEAIERYKSVLEYQVYLPFLYKGLGDAYLNIGEYDSAQFFLRKALESTNSSLKMIANNSIGNLLYKTNKLDSAIDVYQETIQLNQQEQRFKNTIVARAYQGLGDIAVANDDPQKALSYYQQALINTTFDFNETDVAENPNEENQAISLLQQFQVLGQKGEAFVAYYQQNQDTVNLSHALNCFQEAIRVARHTQKTYDNEEAKLFFVNKVHSVYEHAVQAAYQLYRHVQDEQYAYLALQFSEKSKASVLSEILREVDIKTSGTVNDSLVNEEKLIKQQITANRLKLVESSDSTQNEEYRRKLNDLEIALARVVKQLQRDEKYYQLKYQEDTLDIAAWQSQLLAEDDLLLEYFTGEDQMYIFALSSNALTMHEVSLDSAFRESWQHVQNHLFAYDYGDEYQPQWGQQLYQRLLAPVAEHLAGKQRLVVIPSGELSYLPFELLTSAEQPDRYLLHDYAVNYAFSGALLHEAHSRGEKSEEQKVLAMAPFAGQNVRSLRDSGLNPLYFSGKEVASVGGSLYLEKEATKQQFLKIAGSYNILHLATHASVDDENPLQSFIAFYPQDDESIAGYRLYTHELYNLRLDSVNLVVLSSCDAGNGRLVKGEGIISLARAFAYAGCSNIVTTLWKADDRAAASIAAQMHNYLREGYAKDEALRQAKLDYLDDPEMKDATAPYYWANFVFIGNPAPIYESSEWVWWLIGGGLLLIVVAIGFGRIKAPIRKQPA